ncbi:MAG: DUF697 domain-containing protein [Deltaproteobacteria bacterium]|nr:MAG: DUF697 domain-containing protein [Deltaproteobacteria bacterium]
MTQEDIQRNEHAETIIRNHVIWSMGAGFIPVVVADVLAISALQLDMIRQLSRVYGVDFSETQGKAIVSSLTTSTLARIAAGSVAKLIPGVGSVLGGMTTSIFAGASTYALGQVFKTHFEMGGTILDFDPARLKKMYQEQFEKGKRVAQEWKKQADKEGAPEPPRKRARVVTDDEGDLLAKLKELGQLHKEGVLTDEEFAALKKKLMEE